MVEFLLEGNNNGRVDSYIACLKAVHQTMFAHHSGAQIIDELFNVFKNKLAISPVFTKPDNDRTIAYCYPQTLNCVVGAHCYCWSETYINHYSISQ